MKKSKRDLVLAWLDKARKDIAMARMAIEGGEEFADMASFHAQQAAENWRLSLRSQWNHVIRSRSFPL